MKKTILSVFAFALSAVAFAQVGGTVSDDQNNPLPGASVVIKGTTTTGATTDFDGVFSINAKQETFLLFLSLDLKRWK